MNEKKTPLDIISNRFDAFRRGEPEKIYNLYADESDFRQFFPTVECYVLQYEKLVAEIELFAILVLSETIQKDSAEVEYEEEFKKDGEMITHRRKAFLIQEHGEWKIVTEELAC